jgi:hypothetical protein
VKAWAVAGAALVGAIGMTARIAEAQSEDALERHWSLGLQVGPLDRPAGHLGIPLTTYEDGRHLAAAFVGRYQLDQRFALNAGFGVPTSAMGPAVWAGFELFARLATSARGVFAFELYEDAGLQLSFAGPDYYARRDNDFVGYGYAYGGPLAFAVRLPVGVRLCWFRNRLDTFLEGVEMLALTPSVESLFELSVGIRVHW